MTKKQIEYICLQENRGYYFDRYERTISFSSSIRGLNLIFELDIPKEKEDEDFDDTEILENVKSPQSIAFLELCRIEKISISDGYASFLLEEYDLLNNSEPTESSNTSLRYIMDYSAIGKLFAAVNKFYLEYKRIPFYIITEAKDDGYCPPSNYKMYMIEFKESEFDLAITFFKSLETNYPTQYIKSVYLPFCKYNILSQHYYHAAQFSILQSNTKARRIGYLKDIIDKFNDSNYYPVNYLAKKIELDAYHFDHQLFSYKTEYSGDDKGLIKITKTGNSAVPYIEMLIKLNLVTEVNRSYILTKQAKVYSVLRKAKDMQFSSQNIFKLDILDKAFFLQKIFEIDGLYMSAVLDIITFLNKTVSTTEIKGFFQNYIIDEIDRVTINYSISNDLKRTGNELKKRIKSWKKPEIYLGHIIEPRLNWLLDLELISICKQNKNAYLLTEAGKRLTEILTALYEETELKSISLKFVFSNYLLQILEYTYQLKGLKKEFANTLVEKYILEAFKLFKTEAPNRIAASQAIEYVSFKAFLNDHTIMEATEIKDYLLIKNIHNFALDWFASEGDGALSIKR